MVIIRHVIWPTIILKYLIIIRYNNVTNKYYAEHMIRNARQTLNP